GRMRPTDRGHDPAPSGVLRHLGGRVAHLRCRMNLSGHHLDDGHMPPLPPPQSFQSNAVMLTRYEAPAVLIGTSKYARSLKRTTPRTKPTSRDTTAPEASSASTRSCTSPAARR